MTHQATAPSLSPSSLSGRKDAPSVPFSLPLKLISETGASFTENLQCQAVLRFLPGKRLVVRALFQGQLVIAKCFFGPAASRDRQREIDGIAGFVRSGVQTPELISHHDTSHVSYVFTRCLEPVESFEQVWAKEQTDDQRKEWLTHIAGIMAQLHKANVRQDDIHLDNLLIHNDTLYLIDGGGAKLEDALSAKSAIENLALFQAVLFPEYDRFLETVWNAYHTVAPKLCKGTSLTELSLLVQEQRKWREKFVQKALRNCTRFRVKESFRHFLSVDRSYDTPALRAFLEDPDTAMGNGKPVKQGRTNTLAVVTLDDGVQVMVKRYKSTKGILHKYLRCLRESRARVSWINGFLLEMLGIATPQPYAMLEKRFGTLTTCSYIINAYEPALHALDWFSQSPMPDNHKDVARRIELMLKALQRSLIFHSDLKATNILLKDGHPMLIDLDSMVSYKNPARFAQANKEDIRRFEKNWDNHPDAKILFAPVIKDLNAGLE